MESSGKQPSRAHRNRWYVGVSFCGGWGDNRGVLGLEAQGSGGFRDQGFGAVGFGVHGFEAALAKRRWQAPSVVAWDLQMKGGEFMD